MTGFLCFGSTIDAEAWKSCVMGEEETHCKKHPRREQLLNRIL